MKTSIIFFNNDCFYFMQYFRLQSTLLSIRVVSFLTHAVALRSPLNINATGISSPIPAPRLTLFAVTLTHIRVPGNLRNCRNTRATFAGTCPTTLSSTRLSWITATASLSAALSLSCLQKSDSSPTTGLQIFAYAWYPRTYEQ